MNFVKYVHYTDQGEILMIGSMPEADMAIQAGNFMEGLARPGLDYVVDGVVVPLPEQPSPLHTFDYAASSWVLDEARAWAAVRFERDRRIAASDWTTLPDVPLPADQRAAWATYRQALRDITNQPDPASITWPEKPHQPD